MEAGLLRPRGSGSVTHRWVPESVCRNLRIRRRRWCRGPSWVPHSGSRCDGAVGGGLCRTHRCRRHLVAERACQPYFVLMGLAILAWVTWYPGFMYHALAHRRETGTTHLAHTPGVLALGLAFGVRLLLDFAAPASVQERWGLCGFRSRRHLGRGGALGNHEPVLSGGATHEPPRGTRCQTETIATGSGYAALSRVSSSPTANGLLVCACIQVLCRTCETTCSHLRHGAVSRRTSSSSPTNPRPSSRKTRKVGDTTTATKDSPRSGRACAQKRGSAQSLTRHMHTRVNGSSTADYRAPGGVSWGLEEYKRAFSFCRCRCVDRFGNASGSGTGRVGWKRQRPRCGPGRHRCAPPAGTSPLRCREIPLR